MKKLVLTGLLLVGAVVPGLGQATQNAAPVLMSLNTEPPQPTLPRFELDFRGGGPKELVATIASASGHPLNVIIPPQCTNVMIPPMKLRNVTVPEVLYAVSTSSVQEMRTEHNQPYSTSYGFETQRGPQSAGQDAVWIFRCQTSLPTEQRTCLFFQLADYLQTYTVEDITTAIRTGWSLQGIKSPPELKFHPETGLLIAVGSPEDLRMIQLVLSQLHRGPKSTDGPGGAAPKKDGAPAKQ